MNMNNTLRVFLFVYLFLPLGVCAHILDYDLASYEAQHGDWESAEKRFNRMLVDEYQNPGLLYDSGVVAYQQGDYKQARDYFDRATSSELLSDEQKEEVLFNSGNASVNCDDLLEALKKYEDVLEINHENEYAQHNRHVVQNMIREQEKKEQEQQEKEQQENEEQDQEQDDQQQPNQDAGEHEQNDNQEKQSPEEPKKNDNPSPEGELQEKHDNPDSDGQGCGCDQSGSGQEEDQKQNSPDNAHDGNQEDQLEQPAGNRERQQQQKKQNTGEHDSSQQQLASNTPVETSQHSTADSEKKQETRLEPRLAALLDQLEKKDKAVNAQLAQERMQSTGMHAGEHVNGW